MLMGSNTIAIAAPRRLQPLLTPTPTFVSISSTIRWRVATRMLTVERKEGLAGHALMVHLGSITVISSATPARHSHLRLLHLLHLHLHLHHQHRHQIVTGPAKCSHAQLMLLVLDGLLLNVQARKQCRLIAD